MNNSEDTHQNFVLAWLFTVSLRFCLLQAIIFCVVFSVGIIAVIFEDLKKKRHHFEVKELSGKHKNIESQNQ